MTEGAPVPIHKTLGVLSAAVLSAVLLAGCTANDGDAPDKSPTASSTARSEQTPNPTSEITGPPIEKADVPCTDGTATIADVNNKEVTIGDCATVVVESSNTVIHLGTVKDLSVKGAINGIDVESVASVTITGDGNRITTDAKPKVKDSGTSNTVGR
ncbi:DUF3060 domain-containing protein [Curtobacterium sp. L1-20]|uniref:DUF3060 domain-containing protein n=1 Tax=Curtobacterium sp. L1-20 TaxID=3138181 RepID=UPI003B51A357